MFVGTGGWMSGATPDSVEAVLPLASLHNVNAKITFPQPVGGTATPGPVAWEDAHPMMRKVVDAFGSGRCLGASNFCGEVGSSCATLLPWPALAVSACLPSSAAG